MSKDKLVKIKQDIVTALKSLGLLEVVYLDEIEKEISQADTSFQSPLILGILGRIMRDKDDETAKIFIPAVTEWKNYLPHKDLGGLSPAEHMRKYPPGYYETRFIAELMGEYQKRLEINPETNRAAAGLPDEPFDLEADFNKFQKEYLNRLPLKQPFVRAGNSLMTIREIIIEERRQGGRPEKDIDKIGLKIFAENTAEGAGWRIAEIEDFYVSAMEELAAMQANHKSRSLKRVREIRKQFEQDEPYHRCGPAPHQFYCNYAAVVLLDNENDINFIISLLDKSLAHKPDYDCALQMKRNLRNCY